MSEQPRSNSFSGFEPAVLNGPIRVGPVEPFLSALEGNREISPRTIRAIIRARASRAEFFCSSLFADPAWDMLLALFGAELEQRRVSVGSLCNRARVPATTALRWIDVLLKHGLVEKRNDPLDRRRVHVSLTADGSVAMGQYFAAVPQPLAVL